MSDPDLLAQLLILDNSVSRPYQYDQEFEFFVSERYDALSFEKALLDQAQTERPKMELRDNALRGAAFFHVSKDFRKFLWFQGTESRKVMKGSTKLAMRAEGGPVAISIKGAQRGFTGCLGLWIGSRFELRSPSEARCSISERFGLMRVLVSAVVSLIAVGGMPLAICQTWLPIVPTGQLPGPAGGLPIAYNPSSNRLIRPFAALTNNGQAFSSDTWILTNANGIGGTPVWSKLTVTSTPPLGRNNTVVAYDRANNRLILFGGCTSDCQSQFNDTWVLTNADGTGGTAQWTQLNPSGARPVPRSYATGDYDPVSNRLIVFGGGNFHGTLYNDTWALTNANGVGGAPQWVQLLPTGALPGPRESLAASYDQNSNRLIIFGGVGGGNQTWVLTNANGLGGTPQWIQMNPANSPNRNGIRGVYDTVNNRFMFCCGADPATGEKNDAWALSNANGTGGAPEWMQISVTGTPPLHREDFGAAYDQATNRMIIHGGNYLNDTWVLTNANGIVGSQLQITQIQPNHGGNAGQVTVRMFGSGFVDGEVVKLSTAGQPDITGTNVTAPNSTLLAATFDLTAASPGPRNLVVTNPDNSTVNTSGGFTVDKGGTPAVGVSIVGRSQILVGSPQTYYLELSNTGSVDSAAGIISFTLPVYLTYSTAETPQVSIAGSAQDSGIYEPDGISAGQILFFASQGVPTGQTQIMPIQMTVPAVTARSTVGSSAQGSNTGPFNISAAWQDDLISLTFDQVLGLEKIPYIPFQPNCSQCYTQAYAQATAANAAQSAYAAYQNAADEVKTDQINVYVVVGGALVAATLVEAAAATLELSAGTAVALKAFVDVTSGCVRGALDHASESGGCIADVISAAGIATVDLAAEKLAGEFLIRKLLNAFSAVLAAVPYQKKLNQAILAKQAAEIAFLGALGPYKAAHDAYGSCLATHCGAQPTPPPPSPPGPVLPVTPVSSIDPNAKTGASGVGSQQFISGSSGLAYLIEFANEATATAPVHTLTVQDHIDATKIQLATLSVGPIVINDQILVPPSAAQMFDSQVDLRPKINLLVNVHAALNVSQSTLTWQMSSVDPTTGLPPDDPSVGFLAPGQGGSVSITASQTAGLSTETNISNQATITFDNNAPLDTPIWVNTIDSTAPTTSIKALSATQSQASFNLEWSGTDQGSGIANYTIYAAQDGGPLQPWLSKTTATSAAYQGAAGHSYGFFSIGQDLVGNVEPNKSTAEANTTVTLNACAMDQTSNVLAQRGGFRYNRATNTFVQVVNLVNLNSSSIAGPLTLILDSLSGSATLSNRSGLTSCRAPLGSSYVNIAVDSLRPGQGASVTLQFTDPSFAGITYSTRVLSGTGGR
jgi:hypothetical protein